LTRSIETHFKLYEIDSQMGWNNRAASFLIQTGCRIAYVYTRGVQKVLQIDIQKIHKALEFDFI